MPHPLAPGGGARSGGRGPGPPRTGGQAGCARGDLPRKFPSAHDGLLPLTCDGCTDEFSGRSGSVQVSSEEMVEMTTYGRDDWSESGYDFNGMSCIERDEHGYYARSAR